MSENQIHTDEQDEIPSGTQKMKWAAFVESSVVDFFMGHKLEKMSIEDGNGNKAKLSLTKDSDIKVEYSSITIL